MECEEPAACLVHALGDEVGGEKAAVVECFLVFERIVNLGIWHGPAVEPYVDKIGLAMHRFSRRSHKHDVVDIGTVQVDAVVVFRGIVAWHEAFVAQGIGGHHSGGHSFVDFIEESLHGIDAYFFLAAFGTPYWQRGSPEA